MIASEDDKIEKIHEASHNACAVPRKNETREEDIKAEPDAEFLSEQEWVGRRNGPANEVFAVDMIADIHFTGRNCRKVVLDTGATNSVV